MSDRIATVYRLGTWKVDRETIGAGVWFVAWRENALGNIVPGTFKRFGLKRAAIDYIKTEYAKLANASS